MEKEKKKETPEDAQDNERKTKEKVQKDELKREFKPTKKESETKMQMNKAMLKGNKEERKRRRMAYMVPKWDLPIYFGIRF